MSVNPLDSGCLRLFDIAARQLNLSRAATMLGMTQPALSYRIRQMEDLLGTRLFHRRRRGLELTTEGETLHSAVRYGLERLDEAVASISRRSDTQTIRLATDYAFAAFRLMPRMAEFRRAHPEIDVHIVATQSHAPGLGSDVDLAVLFGARESFEGKASLLTRERATAVCTPGFLQRFGPFDPTELLLEVPLIHLEGDDSERWFSWNSWLAEAGVEAFPTAGHIGFNTYTLVMQAVQAEQGVALGWYGLIDDLLASGAIVQACDVIQESERGYWLLQQEGTVSPETELVAKWLQEG